MVGPHLPYLRRFSRALTGSQKSGDAYVEALLETIIANPDEHQDASSGNSASSSIGCSAGLWESISLNLQAGAAGDHWERAAQLKLANIAATSAAGIPAYRRRGLLASRKPPRSSRPAKPGSRTFSTRPAARSARSWRPTSSSSRTSRSSPWTSRTSSAVSAIASRRRADAQGSRDSSPRPTGPASSSPISSSPTAAPGIDAVNDLLGSFEVPVIFITAYPGEAAHRRPAGARLPDHQAVLPGHGEGDDQPGAVLRYQVDVHSPSRCRLTCFAAGFMPGLWNHGVVKALMARSLLEEGMARHQCVCCDARKERARDVGLGDRSAD